MASLPQSYKQWILVKKPDPSFTKDSFELRDEKLDVQLNEGEILVRTIYISLDPSIRHIVDFVPTGSPMTGFGLGRVVKSKSSKFPQGEYVQALLGYREYAVLKDNDPAAFLLKAFNNPKYPLHLCMNNLGITGLAGYFGVISVGKVKEGETFLVSAAGGATGLAAGIIAKIKGCRVVGIAGTDQKCKDIVEKFGFDAAINYKTAEDISSEIKKHCPKGVDVYFDNVGGPILDAVLTQISQKARIVMCGAISQYNTRADDKYGVKNTHLLIAKEGKMEGLMLGTFLAKFQEAERDICKWIDEKKMPILPISLKKGIENTIDALIEMFEGKNNGKSLVQVAALPAPFKE